MATSRDLLLDAIRAASDRLGADLRRTVGRELELGIGRLNDLDRIVGLSDQDLEDHPRVTITVDGTLRGGFGLEPFASIEDTVAEIADNAQEHTLHEEIWGGWPTCSHHRTHPLTPTVVDHQASWVCPTDRTVIARIGGLRAIA